MTVVSSADEGAPQGSRFALMCRSFAHQVLLALGIRGIAWASAAATIGLVCSVISVAALMLSLAGPDVAAERREAAKVRSLERSARMLMRAIHQNNYGVLDAAEGGTVLRQSWSNFELAIASACPQDGSRAAKELGTAAAACNVALGLHELLAPTVDGMVAGRLGVERAVMAGAMTAYGELSKAHTSIGRGAEALVDHIVSSRHDAIIVLAFSTAGFAGAGLVLIFLVARTSMRHYEQWRLAVGAASAAVEARDLLRETIDALPDGVTVYDRDERLLLFNPAAARVNPVLDEPGAIGRSYEELSREVARRLEAEGHGRQPVEEWLARFRVGGRNRDADSIRGRWYSFAEQRTPTGRTVGLRMDVTELKERELEAERANVRYQSLVDSLSDVVYELDVETGRFTFAGAAIADIVGIPAAEFVGKHFLEVTAPAFRDYVAQSTQRPYHDSDRETVSRFAMLRADGRTRHVELRARRRIDERGKVISTGVIRDVEQRVQLERRLDEETARLRAMFDTDGAMIALLDRDLRYTMVNREFTRVTGRSLDDLIGRTFEEVFGQESAIDREMLDRWRARPLPAGCPELMHYAMTIRDREGKARHFNVTANPVADGQGMLSQIVFLVVEDTERREALDLLKETMDTVPAGIVVYDEQERLVMFNEAAKAATPVLRRPGAIGITYEELARDTAALAREFGAPLENTPEEWIERFRSKGARRMRQSVDGRWFEWSEKLTPSGRTVGLRVDVTDLKTRELELERTRGQFQALVDSLSDVVYALDVKGRFAFVSASAADLLGVPAHELKGRRFVDYVVPEQVSGAIARGREHYGATDESVKQIQLMLRRSDGGIRHVEVRYRKPAGGVSDEVVQVGAIRDVTERIDLTERLQKQVAEVEQARADYEGLVDSLSDIVVKIDAHTGTIRFASAAALEQWGYAPSEMVGKRAFDLVAADDMERVMLETQAALKSRMGTHQIQYRVRTRNGEERPVEARYRWMPGPDGRAVIVAVARDIGQRVQLESRLAEETARLRSIFDTGGAVMALLDTDLRYVMINRDFTVATGLPPEQIIGRTPDEVLGSTSIDLDMVRRWKSGPLRPGQDEVMRYTRSLRSTDGRVRHYSTTVKPIADKQGNLRQLLLLALDETERREVEQALFDAERLTTVGEMAATLAHEISQPLQVIAIACASAAEEFELAREGNQPPDMEFVEEKVGRISRQLDRVVRIIGELRAFVRGTAEEAPAPFDPAVAVQEAIDLTSHGVRQARAVVTATMAPALPLLVGHVGRLEQVLINLINNARDAGARTIEVHAAPLMRDDRELLRIAVEDSGPGIAREVLPRLFESFVTTKPRGKGTGLGLRICRRIIEEMGGTIGAANRSEGGARFEILLPTADLDLHGKG